MDFPVLIAAVGVLAGAVASVAGFGIGSLLTPLLAVQAGTKLAVAAVSIPHFLGTAVRCWMLRKDINRQVLLSFGITSAIGGLLGALLHNYFQNPAITLTFGAILIFAGIIGATEWSRNISFRGWTTWIAGAISGGFGGLVGNQGGIRSAALLTFDLEPAPFVATATAIGIFVDAARMPVYFLADASQLASIWTTIATASVAVIAGTFVGTLLLKKVDKELFKRLVSAVILVLGVYMLRTGLGAR